MRSLHAKLRSLLFLAAVMAASSCGKSTPTETSVSPVYQGTAADSSLPISHAAILIQGGGHFEGKPGQWNCSGTVLSKRIVLTAAHCLGDEGAKLEVIDKGRFFFSGVGVEEIYKSPGYSGSLNDTELGFDLALLRLSSDLSDFYRPAVIETRYEIASKQALYLAGFGEGSGGSLAYGPVTLSENEHALLNDMVFPVNRPYAQLIKLRKTPQTASVCKGDSGGPVYYVKDGVVHVFAVNAAIHGGKVDCAYDVPQLFWTATTLSSVNSNVLQLGLHILSPDDADTIAGPIVPIEENKDFPAYYLKHPELTKNENAWIENFSDHVAVLKTNSVLNTFSIVSQEVLRSRSLCQSPSTISSFLLIEIPASVDLSSPTFATPGWIRNPAPSRFFTGAVQLVDSKLSLVITTPDGFVSAQVPVISAQAACAD